MGKSGRDIFKKWFWIILFSPFVILIFVLLMVGIFSDIPSFEELEDPKNNLATEIISEDGEILSTFHIENRSYVTYDELSPSLVQAAVATEDIRFYSHSGIDFRSLARVAVKSLLMGQRHSGGGGSTLSQQLAKTLFPRDTVKSRMPGVKSAVLVISKFKEWITAVKLERNYTKNEILSMYMNSVFFGSNAYGIKAAANTFFGKHPSQLTVEESALLVGMVNKPTRFSPVINPEQSLQRRNHVINQMRKYGFLDRSTCDSVKALPITLAFSQQDHNAGLGPYFRDMLRRVMSASKPERSRYNKYDDFRADSLLWRNDPLYGWLEKNRKPDGSRYNLDKEGLKIYTTINSRCMQKRLLQSTLGRSFRKFSTQISNIRPTLPSPTIFPEAPLKQ